MMYPSVVIKMRRFDRLLKSLLSVSLFECSHENGYTKIECPKKILDLVDYFVLIISLICLTYFFRD
jgi:hypothetical protein